MVGARPRAATFTSDSSTAYASSEISGEIQKVNMESFETVDKARLGNDDAKPKDLRLDRDERFLYVAGGRANTVFVLDTRSMEVVDKIPVGKRVWGLAMNRDKSRLFTTDGVSGTVSVIATGDNEVIKTIEVGEFPWGVVVDD